jgi:hypothetical protein
MMVNSLTIQEIQARIKTLPNHAPFMLDQDLACLYDTEVRHINQAVKRNLERFPSDFCFQLTKKDVQFLRSQSVIANSPKSRTNPYGFTREGANMLCVVLHTKIAVERSIQIMRAFSALESQKGESSEKFQEKALTELRSMMSQILTLAQNWEKMSERMNILENQMDAVMKVKGTFNENHWLFGKFAETVAEGIDYNRDEINKLKAQFEKTSKPSENTALRTKRK